MDKSKIRKILDTVEEEVQMDRAGKIYFAEKVWKQAQKELLELKRMDFQKELMLLENNPDYIYYLDVVKIIDKVLPINEE